MAGSPVSNSEALGRAESAGAALPALQATGVSVVVVDGKLWSWPCVRQALPQREGFYLVQGPAEPRALLSQCDRIAPCILLLDQDSLSAFDGSEFSSALDFGRSVRVLVRGLRPDDGALYKLIRMGCMGFIVDPAPALLRRAVRAMLRGEMWFERRLLTQVLQALLSANSLPRLTIREQEVLRLVAAGSKNREIAEKLFITHETVRWHIRSLNGKLGAHDRLEMALLAQQYFAGSRL